MAGALGLDLSTHCGFAFAGPEALAAWPRCGSPLELAAAGAFPEVLSGTWEIGCPSHAETFSAFRARLGSFFLEHKPSMIWFERPLFSGQHKGNAAAVLAFGLAALTEEVAITGRKLLGPTLVRSVAISTVKKHFAGSGKAKKPDMIAAARSRGWSPGDDNEADALAVLSYGIWTEIERRESRRVAA